MNGMIYATTSHVEWDKQDGEEDQIRDKKYKYNTLIIYNNVVAKDDFRTFLLRQQFDDHDIFVCYKRESI